MHSHTLQCGAQLRAPTPRAFPIPHHQSPQHPGLPLTWGRPAEAGSVLAGQERMAGCAGCESSRGSWERGGDSRGQGLAWRQLPACCVGSHSACTAGRAGTLQGCAQGAWISWGHWGVPVQPVLLFHHVVLTAAPAFSCSDPQGLLQNPPRMGTDATAVQGLPGCCMQCQSTGRADTI